MLQNKYLFHTFDELKEVIGEIKSRDEYERSSGILLQLYNPKVDAQDDAFVEYINSECEKACLVGITCANIADPEYDIKDKPLELNVTLFEKAKLYEYVYDMHQTTGFEAGLAFSRVLEGIPDAKAIQICYTCSSMVINSFTKEFRNREIPVFGARAGRNSRELNEAKVYGRSAELNAIVAVIFAGEDLHLYMDNCFGFKEIGVEMTVTEVEGESVIKTIDNRPATEVYSKYLKVRPNKYFVQNVCEFPLVFRRNECPVARVPLAYGRDGSIIFTADVVKGERFRLSYGNRDLLFDSVDRAVEGLKKFEPQAVYLFECSNRVRLLKDAAIRETSGFLEYRKNTSVGMGYAEMFISKTGDGGALNSALVVVGMSEDQNATDKVVYCSQNCGNETDQTDEREYIPFLERILNFLDKTSSELSTLNRELGRMALTDQLTKVYNRWELEHKIKELLEKVNAGGKPVSLIFLDIDHFKKVNDTFGHDMGDLVLKATANIIKDNVKNEHIFGRWGGEEFICVMPETEIEEARQFAEKLRAQIEETCYITVRHITISVGVTMSKRGDDIESFVKRADEALYSAKETGRNRVVVRE